MFPNSIEKVQEISYVCGKGYCASFAASATLFPISIDKIKPIPLTPEILEKNYFKKCVVANGMEIDKKFNPYHITEQLYIHDGMCGTIVCCSDGGSTLSPLFECKYVHQLQHILKASGILNEIVL